MNCLFLSFSFFVLLLGLFYLEEIPDFILRFRSPSDSFFSTLSLVLLLRFSIHR